MFTDSALQLGSQTVGTQNFKIHDNVIDLFSLTTGGNSTPQHVGWVGDGATISMVVDITTGIDSVTGCRVYFEMIQAVSATPSGDPNTAGDDAYEVIAVGGGMVKGNAATGTQVIVSTPSSNLTGLNPNTVATAGDPAPLRYLGCRCVLRVTSGSTLPVFNAGAFSVQFVIGSESGALRGGSPSAITVI